MDSLNFNKNEEPILFRETDNIDLKLNRIEDFLKEIKNPCALVPAIQIAGTNGKGSIASFIENSLKEAKISFGVYTSPHLKNWCERIRVNGCEITKLEFKKTLKKHKNLIIQHKLTPFEILFALALDYFSTKDLQLIVLEVGLGGRLDATTSHPTRPIIAMSSIGLDHKEYLGESLEDITKEKAAIIKPGCTVISSQQHPEVCKILEEKARENNAKIKWVNEISKDWKLGIPGKIQYKNAAVAKAVLEELNLLNIKIKKEDIKRGLETAYWPGRMQLVKWQEKPILLDAAHNPPAAKQLSLERKDWPNQENGVVWILGIQKKKEGPQIVRNLIQKKDIAWIIPIPNFQSWSKRELCKACPEIELQLRQADDIQEVLAELSSARDWPKPPPVLAGSLYLIGDILQREIFN